MSAEAQLTPMMAQYRRIKSELPKDALLLFRLGDFYEMFFEDAKEGAALINLALTARNGVPMCGLPFHAANGYISRLLKAGRKVAICEQTEDAKPGKLVNRQVTQILSPGTHFDERMLVAERNNFLAAVVANGKTFGLALVDLTTGDFFTTEVEVEAALLTELERLRPAEIVHPMEATTLRDLLRDSGKPWVLVANKVDDPRSTDFYEFYTLGAGDPVPVSAGNGTGTGDLLDIMVERLTGLGAERIGVIGNTPTLRVPRGQREPAAVRRETGAGYFVFGQVQDDDAGVRKPLVQLLT